MEIAGKVAVITGGGSGIGRATAERLVAEGASVMLVELDEKAAQDTVAAIQGKGGKAAYRKADVTDADQMRRVMEDTDRAVRPPGYPLQQCRDRDRLSDLSQDAAGKMAPRARRRSAGGAARLPTGL